MAPLRVIFNMLGVDVSWDPDTNTVTGKKGDIDFQVHLDTKSAVINGDTVEMAAVPVVEKNVTYVPMDFIIKASNGKIVWKPDENKVLVDIGQVYNMSETAFSSQDIKTYTTKVFSENADQTGNIMLVNRQSVLSENYIPNDLVSILDKNKKFIIPAKASNIKMKKATLDAAVTMFRAANKAGLNGLVVSNAYRPYDFQKRLYTKKVNFYLKKYRKEEAISKAGMIVAPPGQSEHQTGLAIDITTKALLKTGDPLVEAFAKTPEGRWIYENSWKYGFIIRYLPNKTNTTHIVSEPWHIRYVGAPHAEFMYKNRMCLEEYLNYIKTKAYIKYKDYSGQNYEILYINTPSPVDVFTAKFIQEQQNDISGYAKSGFIITRKVEN